MAKLKADWLEEAKILGLDVTSKNTVEEIKQAIAPAKAVVKADESPTRAVGESKPATKAGKRSQKGLAEAEAKAAKEARKRGETEDKATDDVAQPTIKRGPVPKTRPRNERRGKKYRDAGQKIDRSREYGLAEAMKLATETSPVKFDATVELHVRLNADPKQADQNVRETVILPEGSGQDVKVGVFAGEEFQLKARQAGADIVGQQELLEKLDKEQIEFDVLIATPDLMSQLGRYAKLLGPKGLMPNPKSGTVTNNVAQAVKEAKSGRVELRMDQHGIIHVGIGKVSFGPEKLAANAKAVLTTVKSAKPASTKGAFLLSVYATTSMGPSIRISASEL